MKRIIATLALALTIVGVSAQQGYRRTGNTFAASSARRASTAPRDTIVTAYKYQTRDGKTYPIVYNRASGACYVYRKSAKTGKYYRMYMKKEIRNAINQELKK